ncbi:MAG: hypothetical protein IAE97_06090 [Chthoniobacterales bacterium]|nr:hypothetical protein [Chthoniobacterales bacterium]
MRRLALWLGACAALAWGAAGQAQPVAPELLKPENRTISNSKQFTIFGGTKKERGDLARRAEELKTGLLRELQMADEWQVPILIILTPADGIRLRQAPVFVKMFDAEDAGRKVQVDVAPGVLGDQAAVNAGLLRAILLERAVRKQTFEGGRFVEPPSWIAAAMGAALGRGDAAEDARVYSALLEGRGMPRFDRFLAQNPEGLRGQAREIHAAQSLALYQSLVESAGGRRKVVENLTLAEPAKDAMERFGQTWPDLATDPAKLARVWALGVARLASPQRVEFFSGAETASKLSSLLRQLTGGDEGPEPGQVLIEMARTPEGRFRLDAAAADLRRLGFRSHPLYGALVEEYRAMIEDLARKRRRNFSAKYAEAEDLRMALDARSGEITEFLNWYQANGADEVPVVLSTRQLRVPERLPGRNDSISRFLDAIEQRGW